MKFFYNKFARTTWNEVKQPKTNWENPKTIPNKAKLPLWATNDIDRHTMS